MESQFPTYSLYLKKSIGGVIISVLTTSVVDCGFGHLSDQIKDYRIGG